MKRTRVTIKDIAKELNVSASTVSRALQDHPALKQQTKDAVRELAEKLNYRPNTMALNFLKQTSTTIAIIVPDITGYFFSAAVTGIQDILVSSGYNIMICISNESYEEESRIVEKLSKVQIAGILVAPSSTTFNFDHIKKIQRNNIPLVVFDRDCEGVDAHKVLVDDYSGAFEAVEYLIKTGCKKIAHITGASDLSTNNHRLQGYLDALKKNNLPILDKYIIYAQGFTHEHGIKPTESLLKSNNVPDAIFAVNDRLAVSAMRTAKKLNFRIPEDISIIGFDDEPHSTYFTPALSTVWQPVYSMGMLSARILLGDIKRKEDENLQLRYEVFKTELVIRGTSKKL
ncbi:LacI family DNA-binding transcriptional regulator [Aestuariivivens sp. NBU2969]|uniref:LacI family DNA-binding transcriptional regulator n=1 Tax=Aestuariivivens sp. NBU2969 TaxID=2873267 RepID=UPI001CBBFDAB|nr:LacI family DNA-binding transcriptional regulator [Aestuariivivens sp. NBU2969]